MFPIINCWIKVSLAYGISQSIRLLASVAIGKQLDDLVGVLGNMLAYDKLLSEEKLCCVISIFNSLV